MSQSRQAHLGRSMVLGWLVLVAGLVVGFWVVSRLLPGLPT